MRGIGWITLTNREFNWKKQNTRNYRRKVNSEQPTEKCEQNTLSQGHHSLPPQIDRQRSNNTNVQNNNNNNKNKNKTNSKYKHKKRTNTSQNNRVGSSCNTKKPFHQNRDGSGCIGNIQKQHLVSTNTPTKRLPSLLPKTDCISRGKDNHSKDINRENTPSTKHSTNIIKKGHNMQPRGEGSILSLTNDNCSILPITANTSTVSFGSTTAALDIDLKTFSDIQTYNPFIVLSNGESDDNSVNISDITPPLFFLEKEVALMEDPVTNNRILDPLEVTPSMPKKTRKREEELEEVQEEERDVKRGRL